MIVSKFIKICSLSSSQSGIDFFKSNFTLLFYFFIDVLYKILLYFSLTSNLSSSIFFLRYITHLPDEFYLVYFITVISQYVKFREEPQIFCTLIASI